jgi:hypothetical protein
MGGYTEISVCGNRVAFVIIKRTGTYGQATVQICPHRLLCGGGGAAVSGNTDTVAAAEPVTPKAPAAPVAEPSVEAQDRRRRT